MIGDSDVYKIAKFDNIFLIFVIEISHGKVFYSNFKVENIFFSITIEGHFLRPRY